ncbi:MAG: hypothetical protein U9Q95_01830 [Candidatus Eisenbacteria bacterium]|nr:hypothetical protein [Candidatus Eisenbacteria bacterium]
MESLFEYLQEATSGRGSLRFIIQPITATLLGIRAGRHDGRTGAPPYFTLLLGNREGRRAALAGGAKHLSKVFVVAVVFDAILQFAAYGSVRPGWAIAVGLLLAAVPYTLARGLTNRVMRLKRRAGASPE